MNDVEKTYSKPSAFYTKAKQGFFFDNKELLRKAHEQNALYTSQPPRTHCKICKSKLGELPDLIQHGVSYVFCSTCDHLNGMHDDTQDYVNALYVDASGADYSRNYIDQNYATRTADIYVPKVDHLQSALKEPVNGILDVGCGAGYFVNAALEVGFAADGIDVNEIMVRFGNTQINHIHGRTALTHVAEDAFFNAIANTDRDIVSAIGVIEHLRQPELFFDAFRQSKAKYVYYSVPMYSASVLLENIFPGVFPRQLSGGHTHLFTEKSILHMNALLGGQSIAEWRFGTDFMDLYRSMMVMLQRGTVSESHSARVQSELLPLVDDLQHILDKAHFCSEIHVLVSCANSLS